MLCKGETVNLYATEADDEHAIKEYNQTIGV